ncbi:uncharacterized protein LOC141905608 isoform X4 [Tubulanus polymorphus]|uniref:uncharacterized protein LOC141905608 isoform X4 n=1 Tax=Tubulanus polymorphus TaxID=672921 RepID=UPI003DA4886F
MKIKPDEAIWGENSWVQCIVDNKEDFCGEPIQLIQIRNNLTQFQANFTRWNCEATSDDFVGYNDIFDGPGAQGIEATSSKRIKHEWNREASMIIVEEYQDLVLMCTGYYKYILTPLIYHWQRREGPISVQPKRIGQKSKLIFPSIKTTDSGYYECRKLNRADYDKREIIVEVYCRSNKTGKLVPCEKPPKLNFGRSWLTRKPYIGERAEFKIFYYQLNPKDTVDIKCKNDKRLVVNSCRFGTKRVVRKMPTNWGRRHWEKLYFGQWRIRIWDVKWDDYGFYTCWLKNTTNGLQTYFNIRLISPASQSRVKNLQVISVTAESAQISWVSLSSRRNQYFLIEYRLVGVSNWTVSPVVTVETGLGRHQLNGLLPSSEYEIRIRDWNQQSVESDTAPSQSITLITKGFEPNSEAMSTFLDSVVIFKSSEKVTVNLAESPGRNDVTISVLACSLNETTAATPVRCRSFNFSSPIGQMQARIDRNALYRYTVRLIYDGDVIYSRHVTVVEVEDGVFDGFDSDVTLIVCGVIAILLFGVLLMIVYGRNIVKNPPNQCCQMIEENPR